MCLHFSGVIMGRYEIMSINNQRLSFEGCPLVVSKYVINNDRLGDRLFLQILFENIGDKPIKNIFIEITFQTEDMLSQKHCEYVYSDINLRSGESFGLDNMIPLPDGEHIEVKIRCKSVEFYD